jgi:penicillin-binding protein 1A
MTVAVANRPVEQFQTQVPMPDWQLSPEEEMYGDQPVDSNNIGQMMVDENGMPIANPPPSEQGYPQQQQQPMVNPDGTGAPTQQELDEAFPPQQQPQIRRPPPYPQRQPPQPQPQQPRSTPPPEPSQPRPETA